MTELAGVLTGQIALISGAARGVGLACARRIAQLGAHVVLTDVDAAAGAESARQLDADGLRATFAPLDVSDVAAIRARVTDVVSTHGRIDVLVNNAGIALYDDLSDRVALDLHLAVNLFGAYAVTRAFLALLVQSRGAIVNNVSLMAFAPVPVWPA